MSSPVCINGYSSSVRTAGLRFICGVAACALPIIFGTAMAQGSGDVGKKIVETQCIKCHGTGEHGAPKIGDRTAWIPRMKYGVDALVLSAIRGHDNMPARGGMAALTDPELREAIIYMFSQGIVTVTSPAPAAVAATGPNYRIVDGMDVYLGVVSAESIREQHTKADPERSMHKGIPGRKDSYHVNITLLDRGTKAVIADALVEAKVTDPVMGGETKKLELMAYNNAISYGNYFRMPGKDSYSITVQIRRPGISRVIETRFNYRHN